MITQPHPTMKTYPNLITTRDNIHAIRAEIVINSHLNDAKIETSINAEENGERIHTRLSLIQAIIGELGNAGASPADAFLDETVLDEIVEDIQNN